MSVVGQTIARALVRVRADGAGLRLASAALRRRAPGRRAAVWLGWHLGQAAGDRPRVARLRSGSRMVVDVREYAHRHVLLHGVHEEDLTALFGRLATPGWTVLDVGANAGYFSLLAADLGGPASRVVAFEPQPRLVSMLRRSLELNRLSRVTVVEAACAERDGVAALSLSPDPRNSGLSTLRSSGAAGPTLQVPAMRLDRFCEQHGIAPDLVKIDVEGYELDVLRGAGRLLARGMPPRVVCEVWSTSRDAVLDFMAGHGYEPLGIHSDGTLTPCATRDAAWSNLCFQRARL